METLGLYCGCTVESVETVGLYGGCTVESVETLGLYGGCILESVETLGLYGGYIVESVETLGLYGGCTVESVETVGLYGGCTVESVETVGSYGGCIVESVETVSLFLLKYRAPISLDCSSLVCSSLGCSAIGSSISSSGSSEGVVRLNPLIVPNVAETTLALDDTTTSLTSAGSVLIKGEIGKGGGLLDPNVFCVDFLQLGSLLDFVGSLEDPLVDLVSGDVPSFSAVGLFE